VLVAGLSGLPIETKENDLFSDNDWLIDEMFDLPQEYTSSMSLKLFSQEKAKYPFY
jgi:hypothetical protein